MALAWVVCPGQGVSVAALPVVMGREPSRCARPPKVALSLPQVSVPGHISLVTASVCVCELVSVCGCLYVCLCVSVCICEVGRIGFSSVVCLWLMTDCVKAPM